MTNTNKPLLIWVLTGLATLAGARGFGDRPTGVSQNSHDAARGAALSGRQTPSRASQPSGQAVSVGRPSFGFARGDSVPDSVSPSLPTTPRPAPSPVTTYTPPERAVSRGAVRETPAPQVRTYTVPRVVNEDNARNSGASRGGFQPRPETAAPAAPTVSGRTAVSDRTPATSPAARTPPHVAERPSAVTPSPFNPARPPLSAPATTAVPPVHSQRGTVPDARLASSTRGSANLRFGSASETLRSRTSFRQTFGTSLRSERPQADYGRGDRPAGTGQSALSFANRNNSPSSERLPFSSSRYTDGRSSVYRAPDRSAHMSHYNNGQGRPPDHHQGYHPAPYHYEPYVYHYSHHACSPVWYGPVVYPAGSSFGFSWNDGSFGIGLSFSSYSPSYAYSTRYYDSWSCGGWGYSGVYYGGWCDNWYGGFSYVYNPWPVYRTYYLYEPVPVVTRTETVYVTQPPTASYGVQDTAPAAVVQQPADVVSGPRPTQTVWDAAPAVERAEALSSGCFCPCRCNGQSPCTCYYPCGAEYAVVAEQFTLNLAYSPYAEPLNPETLWASYAGLDRWGSYMAPHLYDATVSTENDRP
ncbi:MAG: hypothetical protein WCK89_06040 [bacterium]